MQTKNLSIDSLAMILERMTVRETLDLGAVLIHIGTHPEHAECVTIQGPNDKAALITSSD